MKLFTIVSLLILTTSLAAAADQEERVERYEGETIPDVEEPDTCKNDTVCRDKTSFAKYSIYDETVPKLWASYLTYGFTAVLKEEMAGRLNSSNPELSEKLVKPIKSGLFPLPISMIYRYVEQNKEELYKIPDVEEYALKVIENVLLADVSDSEKDQIWLTAYDFKHAGTECVFAVVRNDIHKRVYLIFRGSVWGNRDWPRNFQAWMTKMNMPKKLRKLVKEQTGNDDEFVLVHKGFYDYLFDNKERTSKKHKYDKILKALKRVYDEYPDYELVVTGHSLGAALSSLMAFKLAGSGKDWIPTPVKCISFSSPLNGGMQFRRAFQILEAENLIRYLRVTNQEDTVPAIPPISYSGRPYKHVGVHLDLYKNKLEFSYPRSDNGLSRALQNNFLGKSWWRLNKGHKNPIKAVEYFHSLKTIEERLNTQRQLLNQTHLDDIYQQYLEKERDEKVES